MNTTKDAAKRIVEIIKQTYRPHTYIEVNSGDFTHLDIKKYNYQRDNLITEGFTNQLDIEILEITNQPHSTIERTFIRTMISEDKKITSEYYQIQPKLSKLILNLFHGILSFRWISSPVFFVKSLKRKHCYGFETELSDGSFIITSNAEDASKISSPLTIDCEYYPYSTPINNILIQHKARIVKKISNTPSLTCRLIESRDDFYGMQHRLQQQKISHRLSMDIITHSELEGLSDNKIVANEIYNEVRKILSKDNFEA